MRRRILVLGLAAACCGRPVASPDAGLEAMGPDGGDNPAGSDPDAGISLEVDYGGAGHLISPLLFGDQNSWQSFGQDVWRFDPDGGGSLRGDVIAALKPLGVTLLRYPSGTQSDFFHWAEAVGPWALRTPQDTFDFTDAGFITELPVFGPDEFAQFAGALDAGILITANVGTGSAEEAAGWLRHYRTMGVSAAYWEIGNENYLNAPNPLLSIPFRDPLAYARAFNDYAAALRAVDPTVQLAAIGCHDLAAGCADWDAQVLENLTERADFIAIHNSYAPQVSSGDDSPDVYRATLAAPERVRANFAEVEADVAAHGGAFAADAKIAVTEFAPLFLASPGETDLSTLIYLYGRNRSLAGALYSALLFHVYLGDPAITMATHINLTSSIFQAAVTMQFPNYSDPNWDPQPFRSAYGEVLLRYAETAGGIALPVRAFHLPTFDSLPEGNVPALQAVPVLDALAAISADRATRWLYVVNRDLDRDVTARLFLRGAGTVSSVTVEQLYSGDYRSLDTLSDPGAVPLTTSALPWSSRFSFTFPAHSWTRFALR
jgi:alpha-L-arabinofuranosidase